MLAEEIVCWCIADGLANNRTELGIHTVEAYRQQGIGSALTAVAVNQAFSLGLDAVSWQCDAQNVASMLK